KTLTVVLSSPAGRYPASSVFTYTTRFRSTGISPSSGAAGTSLGATISGSNLGGATAVAFSGSGVTATIGTGGTASSLPITVAIAAGAGTDPHTCAGSTS